MSSKKYYFTLTVLFILFFGTAFAQNNTSAQNSGFTGSIDEQFDHLLKNSYPYESFKGVRDRLPQFKKNTLDSIKALKDQITAQQTTIASQSTSIDSLEKSLAETKALMLKSDNVSFLGMSLEKGTYHMLLWSLIVILLILLIIFIQRYKSNINTAKESRDAADEIREEFELHRKKAMEREQKLKRDLQDELNKAGR